MISFIFFSIPSISYKLEVRAKDIIRFRSNVVLAWIFCRCYLHHQIIYAWLQHCKWYKYHLTGLRWWQGDFFHVALEPLQTASNLCSLPAPFPLMVLISNSDSLANEKNGIFSNYIFTFTSWHLSIETNKQTSTKCIFSSSTEAFWLFWNSFLTGKLVKLTFH